MRQADDGGHQRKTCGGNRHVEHERAIDLQCIYRQFRQIAERGKAGTEIVDGDAHIHGAQRLQHADVVFDVLHDHAFGDFQFQSGCRLRVDADGPLDLGNEIAAAQLQWRYIDRDAHRFEARSAPVQMIFNGLAQRPAPHIVDQSGFLQNRNEAPGRYQTRVRIIPADQRFCSLELAGREAYFRLIMEHKFFPIERLVQLIFQGQLAGHRCRHFLRIKKIAIVAGLGFFERGLGVPVQDIGICAVIREQRNTNLGGDTKHRIVDMEWIIDKRCHRFLDKLRNIAALPDFRQDHGKMVRAHARQQIDISQIARHPIRDLPQQRIASRLAKAVVDVFEAFQIDQEQGKFVFPAVGAA